MLTKTYRLLRHREQANTEEKSGQKSSHTDGKQKRKARQNKPPGLHVSLRVPSTKRTPVSIGNPMPRKCFASAGKCSLQIFTFDTSLQYRLLTMVSMNLKTLERPDLEPPSRICRSHSAHYLERRLNRTMSAESDQHLI